jgi:hypothetical protein
MSNAKGFLPPYGPPANIVAVIHKWRDHSIPDQVTGEWLTKIGLSPNLESRNMHGLQFLGLIDEGGYPTDLARSLRTAPSDQYAGVLEEIVREAYKPIFSVLDPATASRTQIDDAFRHEKPEAQRGRMVAFFLGLSREAGITLKEPPRGGRPAKSGPSRPRTRKTEELLPPAAPVEEVRRLALPPAPQLDPMLLGIVAKIPELETQQDFDSWVTAFRSAFYFVKKITPF